MTLKEFLKLFEKDSDKVVIVYGKDGKTKRREIKENTFGKFSIKQALEMNSKVLSSEVVSIDHKDLLPNNCLTITIRKPDE